jgi:hypothetical protein
VHRASHELTGCGIALHLQTIFPSDEVSSGPRYLRAETPLYWANGTRGTALLTVTRHTI